MSGSDVKHRLRNISTGKMSDSAERRMDPKGKRQKQRPPVAINVSLDQSKRQREISPLLLVSYSSSRSLHLSLSPQNHWWHREKHHAVNEKERMSKRVEIDVGLHLVYTFCLPTEDLFWNKRWQRTGSHASFLMSWLGLGLGCVQWWGVSAMS